MIKITLCRDVVIIYHWKWTCGDERQRYVEMWWYKIMLYGDGVTIYQKYPLGETTLCRDVVTIYH